MSRCWSPSVINIAPNVPNNMHQSYTVYCLAFSPYFLQLVIVEAQFGHIEFLILHLELPQSLISHLKWAHRDFSSAPFNAFLLIRMTGFPKFVLFFICFTFDFLLVNLAETFFENLCCLLTHRSFIGAPRIDVHVLWTCEWNMMKYFVNSIYCIRAEYWKM